MDAATAVFLALAAVGAAAAGLHMLGWVPPRYRRMLAEVQASTASAIARAVRVDMTTLGRVFEEIPAQVSSGVAQALLAAQERVTHDVGEGVYAALNRVAGEQRAEVEKAAKDALMAAKGSVGGAVTHDRFREDEAKRVVGESILGPYAAVLETYAPSLFEYLQANPDMALRMLEWPAVQAIIQKAASFVGTVTKEGGREWGKHPFLP